jgi:hypothetical protein
MGHKPGIRSCLGQIAEIEVRLSGNFFSSFIAQVTVILIPSVGFLAELCAGIPLIKREEV